MLIRSSIGKYVSLASANSRLRLLVVLLIFLGNHASLRWLVGGLHRRRVGPILAYLQSQATYIDDNAVLFLVGLCSHLRHNALDAVLQRLDLFVLVADRCGPTSSHSYSLTRSFLYLSMLRS